MVTSARHWANGGAAGGQIFAHDISIQGEDPDTGKLSELLPGVSGTRKNDHYRIWGKPLRALAGVVVESWLETMETNTKLGEFPKPTPDPVSGNHFWIQHGDVFVLYAHLQKNTLPAALLKKGAPVKAGQMLGLAENSGNSTNPHTHVQCMRNSTVGPLRAMPFRNGWVLSIASHNPPAKDNPWVRLTADGVPWEAVSIWPASTWPTFKIPAAGIWRGGDWANSFWISPSRAAFEQKAQELFDDQGRRLIHVHTYREGSARRWAGIARSGNWANSFFIGSDLDSFNRTAQDLFDDKGRRLIAVEFLDD